MRHANEDVTDGYAHAEPKEILVVLHRLPSPLTPVATQPVELRKTGTDDTTAHHMAHQNAGTDVPGTAGTGAVRVGTLSLTSGTCPDAESRYDEIGGNRRSSAGICSRSRRNSRKAKNLRPSTQAD